MSAFFAAPFFATMCGYLLNALWQGPLLFGSAWLLAHWTVRFSARSAHRIWVCALTAEVLLPAVPGGSPVAAYAYARAALLHLSQHVPAGHVRITVGGMVAASRVATLPVWAMRSVCGLYAAVLAIFLARTIVAMLRALRLKRGTVELPSGNTASAAYACACERVHRSPGGQQVRVSTTAGAPLTLGVVRPVILLPADLLEKAEERDLEALFAHELTHVARYDFAKNLLYRLGLLPIVFHPAVWLTLNGITETREMICDETAAQTHGERSYARSLLRLAALVAQPQPAPIHAIGLLDAHSFERRILRLTGNRTTATSRRMAAQAACAIVLGATVCGSAAAMRVEFGAPATSRAPRPRQESGQPLTARIAGGVMAGQKLSGDMPVYPPEAKVGQGRG